MKKVMVSASFLLVISFFAFSQGIGDTAKKLIETRGIPISFTSEYGKVLPSRVSEYTDAVNSILSGNSANWKTAMLLEMFKYIYIYYPVFDYGEEKYIISNNNIFAIQYTTKSKFDLPFGILFSDSLDGMVTKIGKDADEKSDYSISFKKLHIKAVTVNLAIGLENGIPSYIRIENAQ
jgi:hypothetical protein